VAVVLGTTLRAIGRGFGNGIFGRATANASAANADKPAVAIRLRPKLVHRSAVARPNGITALFPFESSTRARPTSISLSLLEKMLNLPPTIPICTITTAKSRLIALQRPFRAAVGPGMNQA
jgi:hypothetical protein